MSAAVEIGVTRTLTASHVCAEVLPHEHTWTIEAWFAVPERADARLYQASLDILLNKWRGKLLPPEIEWCEDMAATILTLVNCVEVTIWRRDPEGIGARVRR